MALIPEQYQGSMCDHSLCLFRDKSCRPEGYLSLSRVRSPCCLFLYSEKVYGSAVYLSFYINFIFLEYLFTNRFRRDYYKIEIWISCLFFFVFLGKLLDPYFLKDLSITFSGLFLVYNSKDSLVLLSYTDHTFCSDVRHLCPSSMSTKCIFLSKVGTDTQSCFGTSHCPKSVSRLLSFGLLVCFYFIGHSDLVLVPFISYFVPFLSHFFFLPHQSTRFVTTIFLSLSYGFTKNFTLGSTFLLTFLVSPFVTFSILVV